MTEEKEIKRVKIRRTDNAKPSQITEENCPACGYPMMLLWCRELCNHCGYFVGCED